MVQNPSPVLCKYEKIFLALLFCSYNNNSWIIVLCGVETSLRSGKGAKGGRIQ